MLKLILGRAGTGKSRYLIEQMKKTLAEPGQKCILLVPEQFTLQSEQLLFRVLGPKQSMQVEVLSFRRLVNYVFRITGGMNPLAYADEATRLLVMSQCVAETQGQLRYFAKSLRQPDFLTRVLGCIDEFKAYEVSPDQLEQAAGQTPDELAADKFHELALLYQAYNQRIAQNFADFRDDFTKLAAILDKTQALAGYTLFFDSFMGFTPQEFTLLGAILASARNVYLTAACDGIAAPDTGHGVFSPIKEMVRKLLVLCAAKRVAVDHPLVLTKQRRFHHPALAYLEQSLLFSIPRPYAGEDAGEALWVRQESDPFSECEWAARRICELVREKGYRYRDIVLIYRDQNRYSGILEAVFDKYEIPLFVDGREDLLSKPLSMLILSLFEMITSRYTYESVFRYLKSYLTDISADEIDLIENYVILWHIRGALWRKNEDWPFHPEGFSAGMDEKTKARLDQINQIRARIITPVLAFAEQIKDATCIEICRALYEFLQALGVPERILAHSEALEADGKIAAARAYEGLWDVFMQLLDKMAAVLGEQKCEASLFASFLKVMLAQYEIGIIPTSLDEVVAGAADRVRVSEAGCVFLLGANDGVFPMVFADDGLIDDRDREILAGFSLHLADSSVKKSYREQFLLYHALTKARERVYISYTAASASGEQMRPSFFLGRLIRTFSLSVSAPGGADMMALIQRENGAFEVYADYYHRRQRPEIRALEAYFTHHPAYRAKAEKLQALAQRKHREFISAPAARALFGERLRISPTRLEQFQKCKFSFFCQYGLRLRERRQAILDAPEIGNFIHYVLEYALREGVFSATRQMDKSERNRLIRVIIHTYIDEVMGGMDAKSARFRYLFSRLFVLIDMILDNLDAELSQSEFTPVDFELSIGENGDLPPYEARSEGVALSLIGKVDRVDTYREGEKTYLRIIDYKTGSKVFDLSDVYYGLNMQMLIYLFAIMREGRARYGEHIEGAGVLYVPAKMQMLNLPRDASAEEIEKARRKAFRMNGLLNGERKVLQAMEKELRGEFIPVSLTKAGMIAKTSAANLASAEQFGKLGRHIDRVLKKMGREMAAGDIRINPFKGRTDSCAYCAMRAICGYDITLGGERRMDQISKKQVWEKIEEEESGEGELDESAAFGD